MADHIFLLNLSCWHWSCEAEAVAMHSDYQLHALMLVFPCFVVCSRVWEPITVLMVRIKNRYYPQLKQCCGQDLSTGFFLSSQDLNLQSCRKWCDLGLFFSAASLHRLTQEATWGTWCPPKHIYARSSGPNLRAGFACPSDSGIVPAANLIYLQNTGQDDIPVKLP